ncbi:MAG: hypothetical protein ACYCW6_26130, partial [Candidatus Xenobia bacterium]
MIKRLWIVLTLALTVSAWAMPEAMKKLFHTDDIQKHVVVVQHKDEVSRLQQEGALIAVVQMGPDDVTDEVAAQLMAWVQNGGSLWFQDCRMAARFGMQPAPLTTHDIAKFEERDGKYAGHKIHGMAALGFPASNHSVLTDVDAVAGFLLPVGHDQ